jgi:hypothetical protein
MQQIIFLRGQYQLLKLVRQSVVFWELVPFQQLAVRL